MELYNNSSQPVDISGYYLTDDYYNVDKWTIPANTVIPANDYLIIWADEDSSQGSFHTNFKLSGSGEDIYLLDASRAIADQVVLEHKQQIMDMPVSRMELIVCHSDPNVCRKQQFEYRNYGYSNSYSIDYRISKPCKCWSIYSHE
ncbi:MAG: lamin tail domain-containing protein [Saprospiraceae bacterium]|nr:lamin tail domain-containing protein [Candidatus Brachybacter algidus]